MTTEMESICAEAGYQEGWESRSKEVLALRKENAQLRTALREVSEAHEEVYGDYPPCGDHCPLCVAMKKVRALLEAPDGEEEG